MTVQPACAPRSSDVLQKIVHAMVRGVGQSPRVPAARHPGKASIPAANQERLATYWAIGADIRAPAGPPGLGREDLGRVAAGEGDQIGVPHRAGQQVLQPVRRLCVGTWSITSAIRVPSWWLTTPVSVKSSGTRVFSSFGVGLRAG